MRNVLLSMVHCPSHQLFFHRFQAYVSFEDLRDPIGCACYVLSLNQRAIGVNSLRKAFIGWRQYADFAQAGLRSPCALLAVSCAGARAETGQIAEARKGGSAEDPSAGIHPQFRVSVLLRFRDENSSRFRHRGRMNNRI